MWRTCLAVAMAVTLPVQGLAVPHFHPGEENPPAHDEAPHFHLGGHSHGHHHHSHTESEQGPDEPVPPSQSGDDIALAAERIGSDTTNPTSGDHRNAVYVDGDSSLAPQQRVLPSLDLDGVVVCVELTGAMRADSSAKRTLDTAILSCGRLPLYMATLALRL